MAGVAPHHSSQGLTGKNGPINWVLRKANDPFYGKMAGVYLTMATFCAFAWPEEVVNVIFWFLIQPPKFAWITRCPGVMPNPRGWVMPIESWGVMSPRRLWQFHACSKQMFFWAYDVFDEDLSKFLKIMEELLDHYTNPLKPLHQTIYNTAWMLAANNVPEWGWMRMGLEKIGEGKDEALAKIKRSVTQTTLRIDCAKTFWV
jgi:hypothetical protein